jgi:uncharacterized SAM-binding protein YcdF (DUF218 family)
MRSLLRLAVAIVFVSVALMIFAPFGLRSLGQWLVVGEPLVEADAVFVHSGHTPFRAMEGAELYRRGLAREVWIVPAVPSAADDMLVKLGVERKRGWQTNSEVLAVLEVPASSVRRLDVEVKTTRDEIRAVIAEMKRLGIERVILVTSKQHSRRVRELWRTYSDGSLEALTHPSSDDPFRPDDWWKDMDQAQAVLHELVALVDLWLGSPISKQE